MKKILAALATSALLVVTFATAAAAQDTVRGTVEADPAIVAEAGEITFTAVGSGFIPDSDILVVSCTSPADELIPGVSTAEDITAAGELLATAIVESCDLASALAITTDSDGGWTSEVVADVGPNFFLSAGALDGSQNGAAYIPVGDPAVVAAWLGSLAEAQLAVTGVESTTILLIGATLLMLGLVAVAGARRSEI